ncbi:hypothetical protein BROOK1789C_1695 [Bathymodiolus brooksi thiotrophic gill symbiont]|nr:hypothetical protein BROOK1789C_1695 [Bathymodiolus brooksi thiotrophic gill symbiont]
MLLSLFLLGFILLFVPMLFAKKINQTIWCSFSVQVLLVTQLIPRLISVAYTSSNSFFTGII